MSEPFGSLFTTGQFAALCGTTKDTLFHYDRIGLLKPWAVTESGYRRYTSVQLFEFDLIRVLQQAGSSLQEIMAYRRHCDADHFLELLEEKQAAIRSQLEELTRMEQMLQHVSEATRQGLTDQYDQPRVEWQEPERLLVVELERGEGERAESVAARLGEHFSRCEEYRLTDKFPLGSVILQQEVLAGGDLERYFFSRVPQDFTGAPLLEKPAGHYAALLHKGPADSFGTAWQQLLNYVKEQKLTICGNAYVHDLISYLASGSAEDFVLKISVQVEAGPAFSAEQSESAK